MKKSILKCFEVDDALQDGINEFGRLSGYSIRPTTPQRTCGKKKPLINMRAFMMAASLFLKGLK